MLILGLFSALSFAGPFLEVESLYIDGKSFTGRANDSINEAIGRKLDKSLTLGLNTSFMGFAFFNNKLDGRSGCIDEKQCQFTEISYNFTIGIHLVPWLDLNYNHQSSHALDSQYSYDVEDSIGFRLYLFQTGRNESIFP